ncbi:MAG: trypsin-like peptidase domain-containing protein [Verrucomicrobia bacterium]|nr:trypsin-like peptidase domain-containing protein [Verrucomicrobiota bacterium]
MTLKIRFLLVLALVLAASPARAARPAGDVRDSIVKIYTVFNTPDYFNPWSMRGPKNSTGSGCVIRGRRILTNAHVVEDQTFIQVRRNGDAKRYLARVVSVAHDADLALLTVDDPAFFEGVEPLEFGKLPQTQQEVLVYGFPMGGDTLSITKGVVSRIEHQNYSHSSCNLLAVQIDAAINPGNSGGPAIVDGKIVGVAMMGIARADNIGYLAPVPVIQHMLTDMEDGQRDGIPSLGLMLEDMENPGLRKKYRLPEDRTGVLIVRIAHGAPAEDLLHEEDVLLTVDGHEVANDGTVEFRPRERTSVSYFIQQHQVGETVNLEILRDGEILPVQARLTGRLERDWLVPMEQYDILPTYYIYGGIVFSPLTVNLLQSWGGNWYEKAPKDLVAHLGFNMVTPEQDEVVLALRVLAADVNEGYHTVTSWTVEKVNGQKVRNLRHLIELIENAGDDPFIVLENEWGQKLVLDREMAGRTGPQILQTYRIPKDRSPDLAAPSGN